MGQGKVVIVCDTMQIERWAKEQMKILTAAEVTSAPTYLAGVQMLRSLIHELGHLRLSEALMETIGGNAIGKKFVPATPAEEQKAWVFAFMFLGLLIGAYAFQTRRDERDCDDAPKLVV
jgi:hypothetical protein